MVSDIDDIDVVVCNTEGRLIVGLWRAWRLMGESIKPESYM
jgi:hypothetical protein